MHCSALSLRISTLRVVALIIFCLASAGPAPGVAQSSPDTMPFKQARYQGNPILIHLPTNAARALVMPEPVLLQGGSEQMPGVELAYEGKVIGFYATRTFERRTVSFVGTTSGTEYQLQIRASAFGIVAPLEIIR